MYSAWAYGWMSQLFKALLTRMHTNTRTHRRVEVRRVGKGEIKDDESKWKKTDEEKYNNQSEYERENGIWNDVFLTYLGDKRKADRPL